MIKHRISTQETRVWFLRSLWKCCGCAHLTHMSPVAELNFPKLFPMWSATTMDESLRSWVINRRASGQDWILAIYSNVSKRQWCTEAVSLWPLMERPVSTHGVLVCLAGHMRSTVRPHGSKRIHKWSVTACLKRPVLYVAHVFLLTWWNDVHVCTFHSE